MHPIDYLHQFEKAAEKLTQHINTTNPDIRDEMEMKTGVWLNSAVLRLQKKHWNNTSNKGGDNGSRIFFSVWLPQKGMQEERIYYNIHALKLRQLKGYRLESRKFAMAFRERFKKIEHEWPNVSVEFGPLTLMEGWKHVDLDNCSDDITRLAKQFLTIDHIIDQLLVHSLAK